MNKYLSVFRTSFKQEKDTIVNVLFRTISFFIIIYVFVQLWQYIYGTGGTSQVIKGFSLGQMIWYLIITEMLYFSSRNKLIVADISKDIQLGSIAYKLNKPYNYYLYQITSFMAKSTFTMLFYFPAALILGFAFIGVLPTFTWVQILPCMLVFVLSILMSWIMYAVVGLLAFWIQDSTPFYWVISKFVMLLGLFFPVQFFPTWLQPFITYSPIYSLMSGPANLFVNFSWTAFMNVAISQVVWSVILLILGLLIFNIGKKKVVSNGG